MINRSKGDFSQGSIFKAILKLALPIMLAELVHITYNIVDRIFIGHIPGIGTLALSGVGVVFPIISFINAFASLCSTGGAPLCSIARGEGNTDRAKNILETSFTLLLILGVALSVLLYIFMPTLLIWMGADESTYQYAKDYFSIYLIGTVFVLISLGANSFINIQGDSVIGMFTVMIGAVLNLILDPVFIFALDMGVKGAAIATVISQFFSAVWVLRYLVSPKTKLRISKIHIDAGILSQIIKLGVSGFMFKMTNSLTQALANITLKLFGGASGTLYIGAMSIINSTREVISLPNTAIASGFQPVASFNFGSKDNSRVKKSISDFVLMILCYSVVVWAVIMIFPKVFISLFTPDSELIELAVPCFRIYFGAFFAMAFQTSGQNTYIALNCPKRAVFFSLFRKVILVAPLTLLLPRMGLGVKGVFIAELISQLTGGLCCFTTMYFTVYRKIKKTPDGVKAIL